jgi:hypothetical protein
MRSRSSGRRRPVLRRAFVFAVGAGALRRRAAAAIAAFLTGFATRFAARRPLGTIVGRTRRMTLPLHSRLLQHGRVDPAAIRRVRARTYALRIRAPLGPGRALQPAIRTDGHGGKGGRARHFLGERREAFGVQMLIVAALDGRGWTRGWIFGHRLGDTNRYACGRRRCRERARTDRNSLGDRRARASNHGAGGRWIGRTFGRLIAAHVFGVAARRRWGRVATFEAGRRGGLARPAARRLARGQRQNDEAAGRMDGHDKNATRDFAAG